MPDDHGLMTPEHRRLVVNAWKQAQQHGGGKGEPDMRWLKADLQKEYVRRGGTEPENKTKQELLDNMPQVEVAGPAAVLDAEGLGAMFAKMQSGIEEHRQSAYERRMESRRAMMEAWGDFDRKFDWEKGRTSSHRGLFLFLLAFAGIIMYKGWNETRQRVQDWLREVPAQVGRYFDRLKTTDDKTARQLLKSGFFALSEQEVGNYEVRDKTLCAVQVRIDSAARVFHVSLAKVVDGAAEYAPALSAKFAADSSFRDPMLAMVNDLMQDRLPLEKNDMRWSTILTEGNSAVPSVISEWGEYEKRGAIAVENNVPGSCRVETQCMKATDNQAYFTVLFSSGHHPTQWQINTGALRWTNPEWVARVKAAHAALEEYRGSDDDAVWTAQHAWYTAQILGAVADDFDPSLYVDVMAAEHKMVKLRAEVASLQAKGAGGLLAQLMSSDVAEEVTTKSKCLKQTEKFVLELWRRLWLSMSLKDLEKAEMNLEQALLRARRLMKVSDATRNEFSDLLTARVFEKDRHEGSGVVRFTKLDDDVWEVAALGRHAASPQRTVFIGRPQDTDTTLAANQFTITAVRDDGIVEASHQDVVVQFQNPGPPRKLIESALGKCQAAVGVLQNKLLTECGINLETRSKNIDVAQAETWFLQRVGKRFGVDDAVIDQIQKLHVKGAASIAAGVRFVVAPRGSQTEELKAFRHNWFGDQFVTCLLGTALVGTELLMAHKVLTHALQGPPHNQAVRRQVAGSLAKVPFVGPTVSALYDWNPMLWGPEIARQEMARNALRRGLLHGAPIDDMRLVEAIVLQEKFESHQFGGAAAVQQSPSFAPLKEYRDTQNMLLEGLEIAGVGYERGGEHGGRRVYWRKTDRTPCMWDGSVMVPVQGWDRDELKKYIRPTALSGRRPFLELQIMMFVWPLLSAAPVLLPAAVRTLSADADVAGWLRGTDLSTLTTELPAVLVLVLSEVQACLALSSDGGGVGSSIGTELEALAGDDTELRAWTAELRKKSLGQVREEITALQPDEQLEQAERQKKLRIAQLRFEQLTGSEDFGFDEAAESFYGGKSFAMDAVADDVIQAGWDEDIISSSVNRNLFGAALGMATGGALANLTGQRKHAWMAGLLGAGVYGGMAAAGGDQVKALGYRVKEQAEKSYPWMDTLIRGPLSGLLLGRSHEGAPVMSRVGQAGFAVAMLFFAMHTINNWMPFLAGTFESNQWRDQDDSGKRTWSDTLHTLTSPSALTLPLSFLPTFSGGNTPPDTRDTMLLVSGGKEEGKPPRVYPLWLGPGMTLQQCCEMHVQDHKLSWWRWFGLENEAAEKREVRVVAKTVFMNLKTLTTGIPQKIMREVNEPETGRCPPVLRYPRTIEKAPQKFFCMFKMHSGVVEDQILDLDRPFEAYVYVGKCNNKELRDAEKIWENHGDAPLPTQEALDAFAELQDACERTSLDASAVAAVTAHSVKVKLRPKASGGSTPSLLTLGIVTNRTGGTFHRRIDGASNMIVKTGDRAPETTGDLKISDMGLKSLGERRARNQTPEESTKQKTAAPAALAGDEDVVASFFVPNVKLWPRGSNEKPTMYTASDRNVFAALPVLSWDRNDTNERVGIKEVDKSDLACAMPLRTNADASTTMVVKLDDASRLRAGMFENAAPPTHLHATLMCGYTLSDECQYLAQKWKACLSDDLKPPPGRFNVHEWVRKLVGRDTFRGSPLFKFLKRLKDNHVFESVFWLHGFGDDPKQEIEDMKRMRADMAAKEQAVPAQSYDVDCVRTDLLRMLDANPNGDVEDCLAWLEDTRNWLGVEAPTTKEQADKYLTDMETAAQAESQPPPPEGQGIWALVRDGASLGWKLLPNRYETALAVALGASGSLVSLIAMGGAPLMPMLRLGYYTTTFLAKGAVSVAGTAVSLITSVVGGAASFATAAANTAMAVVGGTALAVVGAAVVLGGAAYIYLKCNAKEFKDVDLEERFHSVSKNYIQVTVEYQNMLRMLLTAGMCPHVDRKELSDPAALWKKYGQVDLGGTAIQDLTGQPTAPLAGVPSEVYAFALDPAYPRMRFEEQEALSSKDLGVVFRATPEKAETNARPQAELRCSVPSEGQLRIWEVGSDGVRVQTVVKKGISLGQVKNTAVSVRTVVQLHSDLCSKPIYHGGESLALTDMQFGRVEPIAEVLGAVHAGKTANATVFYDELTLSDGSSHPNCAMVKAQRTTGGWFSSADAADTLRKLTPFETESTIKVIKAARGVLTAARLIEARGRVRVDESRTLHVGDLAYPLPDDSPLEAGQSYTVHPYGEDVSGQRGVFNSATFMIHRAKKGQPPKVSSTDTGGVVSVVWKTLPPYVGYVEGAREVKAVRRPSGRLLEEVSLEDGTVFYNPPDSFANLEVKGKPGEELKTSDGLKFSNPPDFSTGASLLAEVGGGTYEFKNPPKTVMHRFRALRKGEVPDEDACVQAKMGAHTVVFSNSRRLGDRCQLHASPTTAMALCRRLGLWPLDPAFLGTHGDYVQMDLSDETVKQVVKAPPTATCPMPCFLPVVCEAYVPFLIGRQPSDSGARRTRYFKRPAGITMMEQTASHPRFTKNMLQGIDDQLVERMGHNADEKTLEQVQTERQESQISMDSNKEVVLRACDPGSRFNTSDQTRYFGVYALDGAHWQHATKGYRLEIDDYRDEHDGNDTSKKRLVVKDKDVVKLWTQESYTDIRTFMSLAQPCKVWRGGSTDKSDRVNRSSAHAEVKLDLYAADDFNKTTAEKQYESSGNVMFWDNEVPDKHTYPEGTVLKLGSPETQWGNFVFDGKRWIDKNAGYMIWLEQPPGQPGRYFVSGTTAGLLRYLKSPEIRPKDFSENSEMEFVNGGAVKVGSRAYYVDWYGNEPPPNSTLTVVKREDVDVTVTSSSKTYKFKEPKGIARVVGDTGWIELALRKQVDPTGGVLSTGLDPTSLLRTAADYVLGDDAPAQGLKLERVEKQAGGGGRWSPKMRLRTQSGGGGMRKTMSLFP